MALTKDAKQLARLTGTSAYWDGDGGYEFYAPTTLLGSQYMQAYRDPYTNLPRLHLAWNDIAIALRVAKVAVAAERARVKAANSPEARDKAKRAIARKLRR